MGFRGVADITRKTQTRLHVPESEEQRSIPNKPQKTPCYVSRALMKNWELSVQQKAGCIRPSRIGATSLPEHLGGIQQAEKLLPAKFTLKHSNLSWQNSRI